MLEPFVCRGFLPIHSPPTLLVSAEGLVYYRSSHSRGNTDGNAICKFLYAANIYKYRVTDKMGGIVRAKEEEEEEVIFSEKMWGRQGKSPRGLWAVDSCTSPRFQDFLSGSWLLLSGVSSLVLAAPEPAHSSILRPKKLYRQWWTISWEGQTSDERLGVSSRTCCCSSWTQLHVSVADGWEDAFGLRCDNCWLGVVVSASRLKWKIAAHIFGVSHVSPPPHLLIHIVQGLEGQLELGRLFPAQTLGLIPAPVQVFCGCEYWERFVVLSRSPPDCPQRWRTYISLTDDWIDGALLVSCCGLFQ